jgi:hypothetical protein
MRSFGHFPRLPHYDRLFSVAQRRLFSTLQYRKMDYDTILQGKYPAKRHAQRVTEYIRSKIPNASGVLYLESRATKLLEDNDEPEPFR